MRQMEKTVKVLLEHYQRYPALQLQDVFKFLFQSSFGCEHLVTSLERVTEYLKKEYENVVENEASQGLRIESLDGDYSRVWLSCLDQGMRIETFAKLFMYSAKTEENGIENLLQKLEAVEKMIREKRLPFSEAEFETNKNAWAEKGYPAVHHSHVFREKYHPAYRLISNDYVPFLPLFSEIDRRLSQEMVIVAIDGGSGSGKTTLSKLLEKIYDCTVFHMDDFFLQPHQRTKERFAEPGGNVDWERFLQEVLIPMKNGKVVDYRRFDCCTMSMLEPVQILPKKLIIIEGSYSLHPELAEHYDLTAFLEILPELQRKRILKRNSPEMATRFFEEWIPMERVYSEKLKIADKCDLKISIAGDEVYE